MNLKNFLVYKISFLLLFVAKRLRRSSQRLSKSLLLLFLKILTNAVTKANAYTDLMLFAKDKHMIFETNKSFSKVSSIEYRIYSTGYLEQVLQKLDIQNARELVKNIQDAFWDVYSELSLSGQNVARYKTVLLNNIKNLHDAVCE